MVWNLKILHNFVSDKNRNIATYLILKFTQYFFYFFYVKEYMLLTFLLTCMGITLLQFGQSRWLKMMKPTRRWRCWFNPFQVIKKYIVKNGGQHWTLRYAMANLSIFEHVLFNCPLSSRFSCVSHIHTCFSNPWVLWYQGIIRNSIDCFSKIQICYTRHSYNIQL